jgi:hypothetical protein
MRWIAFVVAQSENLANAIPMRGYAAANMSIIRRLRLPIEESIVLDTAMIREIPLSRQSFAGRQFCAIVTQRHDGQH